MASRTRKKQQNAKAPAKAGPGSFDKLSAAQTVSVQIASAGVVGFPEAATEANRVWVEWVPSAALEGKRRRMFVSKNGTVDPATILTDGGKQVPRKGMSCNVHGRVAVVFGPGKMKFWVAPERGSSRSVAQVRELPSQLLALVAPSDVSRPPAGESPPRAVQSSSSRR